MNEDVVADAKREIERLTKDREFSIVARLLSRHVEDVERKCQLLQTENTRLVLANRELTASLREVWNLWKGTYDAVERYLLGPEKESAMTDPAGFWKGAGVPSGPRSNRFYECGGCGCYHREDFWGDCREDSERYPELPDGAEEIYWDEDEETDE